MADLIFAALLVAANVGWGVTNALTARNHLREANALETLGRMRRTIDDEVVAAVNRYRELVAGRAKQEDGKPPTVLTDEEEARRERLRQGLSLIDTMPDDTEEGLPTLGELPIDA